MKFNEYIDKEEEYDINYDTDYMKNDQMTMERWIEIQLKRVKKYFDLSKKEYKEASTKDEYLKVIYGLGETSGRALEIHFLTKYLYEDQQWENEQYIKKSINLFREIDTFAKTVISAIEEEQELTEEPYQDEFKFNPRRKNSESEEFGEEVIHRIATESRFDEASIKELVEEIMEEKDESWTSLLNKPFTPGQAAQYFMKIWQRE